MRTRFKKIGLGGIVLILTTIVGLPLSAGGKGETAGSMGGLDKNVTAKIVLYNWGSDTDVKINSAAYARFKTRYPNVTVQDNFVSGWATWAEYINKLLALIAAGNSPDMTLMAIEGARQLYSKNVLVPLDDRIANDKSAQEMLSDVSPTLFAPLKLDGKTYLFPTQWNGMVIYYNTKIFREAGVQPPKADWTLDEFIQIAKRVTTDAGDKKVYGFALPLYSIFLNLFPVAFGTYTLDAKWEKSNLSDPKVLEAFQFLHDMVYKQKVMPVPEASVDVINLFAAGRVAMIPMGHNAVTAMLKNGFKDWDVQYMPHQDRTNTKSIFGVAGYGILKSSKNQDLCWELLKEIAGTETMKDVAAAGVSNPVRKSVANSSEFLKFPPNASIYYGTLQNAICLPAPVNDADYEEILTRHFLEFMSDKKPIADSLADADKELQESFSKLKM
jgi:multiple sugar transport system substrate-binding protein